MKTLIYIFTISYITSVSAMWHDTDFSGPPATLAHLRWLDIMAAKEARLAWERERAAQQNEAQLLYQPKITELQNAITTYNVLKVRECFEQLTIIDRDDKFQLWAENRAAVKLYIQNALDTSAACNKTNHSQQIATEVRAFDQKHYQKNN